MQVVAIFLSQTTPIDPLLSTRLILALLCVVVTSSIAFGVTFGLARRIALLAGQQSSSDDDEVKTDAQNTPMDD